MTVERLAQALRGRLPTISIRNANLRGALWMAGAAFMFTTMATCLRWLALRDYGESQMMLFRCAIGFACMIPFVFSAKESVFKLARPWLMGRRCLAAALGLLFSFYAFAHMPLASAQALSFARSLFVVVLAAFLLREHVGAWRQSAVGLGFLGVLIMLRPFDMRFDLGALAQLASAALMAYAVVSVKDLTRDHSTVTMVFWMNAVCTLVGLPFALGVWTTPGPLDLSIFILLGLAGVLSQTCYTLALTSGDASFISMLDYVRLPLAIVAGMMFFSERPDVWTYLGAAIVIFATAFITLREAFLARRRAPPPAP